MTHETPPANRDSSGRFVKAVAEKAHALNTSSDEGVHPMSKVLFGWTETRGIGAILFWLMAFVSLVLVAIDLVIDRHEYISFANAVGFYGLWGFLAFSFVVLMGWPLGKLLRRDENYYGDVGGPPKDVDPAISDDASGGSRRGGRHEL